MKFPHCVVDFVRPNHWKRIEIILFFFFFLKEDCQSWQHWLRIIKFVVELEIIDWMPGNYPYIIYLNFFELCKQFDISRLPLVFKQCIGKWECNSKSSGMYRVHLANFIWYVFKKIQLRSKWRKKKLQTPTFMRAIAVLLSTIWSNIHHIVCAKKQPTIISSIPIFS